jgi:hypothetical protein
VEVAVEEGVVGAGDEVGVSDVADVAGGAAVCVAEAGGSDPSASVRGAAQPPSATAISETAVRRSARRARDTGDGFGVGHNCLVFSVAGRGVTPSVSTSRPTREG